MKKFRKLVPALCMLLVSAVLMGTSTYAWFSMNTNVSAKGMEISAKSDSTFLVITEGETFDSETVTSITASTTATKKPLFPVMPVAEFASKTEVETAAKWQYAYSSDPGSPTKNGDYVACTDLTNYVASEVFSIGLSKASGLNESVNNIRVKSVTLPENTGISCVIVCGDVVKTYTATSTTSLDLKVKATKAGTQVSVYYFINGDNANVFTNNATNLTGSVEVHFTVDAA